MLEKVQERLYWHCQVDRIRFVWLTRESKVRCLNGIRLDFEYCFALDLAQASSRSDVSVLEYDAEWKFDQIKIASCLRHHQFCQRLGWGRQWRRRRRRNQIVKSCSRSLQRLTSHCYLAHVRPINPTKLPTLTRRDAWLAVSACWGTFRQVRKSLLEVYARTQAASEDDTKPNQAAERPPCKLHRNYWQHLGLCERSAWALPLRCSRNHHWFGCFPCADGRYRSLTFSDSKCDLDARCKLETRL